MLKKLIIPIFIIGSALSPISTKAESQCSFAAEIAKIAALEKNNTQEDQDIELELRIRALKKINGCAKEKSAEFINLLEAAEIPNKNMIALLVYKELKQEWSKITEFYEENDKKFEDMNIEQTKLWARDFLLWREKVYFPLLEETTKFLIWNEDREMIEVAQNRLEQFQKFIETNLYKQREDLRDLLKSAKTSFYNAQVNLRKLFSLIDKSELNNDFFYANRKLLENLSNLYKKLLEITRNL